MPLYFDPDSLTVLHERGLLGSALELARADGRHDLERDVENHARQLGYSVLVNPTDPSVKVLAAPLTPKTRRLKQLIQQEPDDEPTLDDTANLTTHGVQLDTATAGEGAVERDPQGRVILENFDRASYLHDPVAQQRRLERASRVSAEYASSPSLFREHDSLHIMAAETS
jgi:hypothetical protein